MTCGTVRNMRSTKSELGLFVLGVLFLLASVKVAIPETVNRIHLFRSMFIQLALFAVGFVLMVMVIISTQLKIPLTKRKRTKTIITNFIVLLVALLFCAAVVEVVLHVTSPAGCKQDDLVLDHSYIPGCVSKFKSSEWNVNININSHGLRDDEVIPKENFDLRVLMLGDSFTWGYGVEHEETYTEQLQHMLNDNGINGDVVNAGVTSYSPVLEYLYLKNKGLQLQPDIVIMNIDLSDFQDDYIRERDAEFDAHGIITAVPKESDDSFLLSIRKKIKITRFMDIIFKLVDAAIPPPTEFNSNTFHSIENDRYALSRYEVMDNEQEHVNRTLAYIKHTADLAAEYDIQFVLTTYPYGHQVSGEEWTQGRHLFGFHNGFVYDDRHITILEEFAAENGILFISTVDYFRESSEFPLYFPYDGHFTPAGHNVMATALMDGLEEHSLI
jgi:lysophospholipase L1-like esterase